MIPRINYAKRLNSESDPVYVIFSNRHELRRVDTATSSAVSLISGLRNTIALDFYYNRDGYAVLFWTDVMEDKIYRGTMMGNGNYGLSYLTDGNYGLSYLTDDNYGLSYLTDGNYGLSYLTDDNYGLSYLTNGDYGLSYLTDGNYWLW
ncbi:hypothetical protein DPMN_184340 [Dreissena polymorpha]|uniref:Uncharacterized protein n=1 Tax=Dreissena polymorpha TaxID=45954 RepID=A0A9D4DK60_DREPO|nr:hypothetical protein DPMN_184340 [Dreissena polymorpha]